MLAIEFSGGRRVGSVPILVQVAVRLRLDLLNEAVDAQEFGLEEHPPTAGSREELSLWVCHAHNRVNDLLGKPVFPCTLAKLDARWRSGGAHCENALAEANDDD